MAANQYVQMAQQAATKYGVDPNIFVRQIQQESGFNPNAQSGAGAVGIAQFMPATARGMGVNPSDPASALDGAARYDSKLLKQFGGNYRLALAGYNAGGGAARKALSAYPETRNYVSKILGSGGGGSVLAKVAASAAPQAASGVDPQKLAEVSMLFSDDPSFAGIVQQNLIDQSAQTPAVSISGASSGPSLSIPKPGKGATLPYLEKLGAQFGLKNDPGNAQTTGGHHADGSMHYQGRAIDYGDARNSPQQLLGAMKYFRSHPGTVQDAYYNPAGGAIVRGKWVPGYREPGHDNHMHIDA